MKLPGLFGRLRDIDEAEPIRQREVERALAAGVDASRLRQKCEEHLFHARVWIDGAGTKAVDRLIVAKMLADTRKNSNESEGTP